MSIRGLKKSKTLFMWFLNDPLLDQHNCCHTMFKKVTSIGFVTCDPNFGDLTGFIPKTTEVVFLTYLIRIFGSKISQFRAEKDILKSKKEI